MSHVKTDILVVGSGLAGTLFSLELAKKRPDLNILITSKKDKKHSSSYLAQGGIAAVLPDSDDSMEQHVKDTLAAGGFSNDPSVVEYYVSRSPEAILALESWGIRFDQNLKGGRALALEGGHSLPRVLHHKDFTGKHIMQQLYAQLEKYPNIQLLQDVEVFKLIQFGKNNAIQGAYAWNFLKQKTFAIQSAAVVLSTGGVGSLFRYTTNPSTATGQGIALAEKAGAKVKDIINIQFHPTALWKSSGTHLPLISEALRGAGAVLKNESGCRFMQNQHPLQDLAPRDVVARAIIKELKEQRHPYVYLDSTAIREEEWQDHFPGILKICLDAGINPRKDRIPVVPAAHYSCGGVATDIIGKTDVAHLFILGETACTGLHGANRLASNSLLEATLMAKILAEDISSGSIKSKLASEAFTTPELFSSEQTAIQAENYLNEVREIMQDNCSVIKTTAGLKTAAQKLQQLEKKAISCLSPQSFDLINFQLSLYAAKMIVKFCLKATQNRGVFYNENLI